MNPADVVNDDGMTRLEAAERERRDLVLAELHRHTVNTDAELARHHVQLDHIASVFRLRLGMEES